MNDLTISFANSMQAEESFYQAFRERDIEIMRHVWERSNEVICIHPGSTRIYSFELIIASWKEIFSAPDAVNIEITEPVYVHTEDMSIHYVKENLSIDNKFAGLVNATNIYRHTQVGWKMIAHHATPAHSDAAQRVSSKLH